MPAEHNKDHAQEEAPTPAAAAAEEDQDTENVRKIQEHIKNFEVYYTHDVVVKGLSCTTMDIGLAGEVMQKLHEGKGVPSNSEGIWTKRDDESLLFMDEIRTDEKPRTVKEKHLLKGAKAEWQRLLRKHGLERIEERRKFLAYVKRLGIRWAD
jgi:hypothetical protein